MNSEPTYTYDPSAYRALVERHFTYAAGVARNTHRYAHRPALHHPATGRRWTYAELGLEVERVAAGLPPQASGRATSSSSSSTTVPSSRCCTWPATASARSAAP